jgi:thiosulfate/3-mercaptopyruvate sulfurtransferase
MNPFTTLIDVHTLSNLLGSEPSRLLVLDCSHELSNPAAGKQAYDAAHIPGSHFISLDNTLSGEKTAKNGRHPLPDRAELVQAMRLLGADDDTQIIAYDNGGSMYAARLWWLMRWLGHSAVAVLDGGIQAWQAAGLPCTDKTPVTPQKGSFSALPPLVSTVNYADIKANLITKRHLLIDARGADRFRGENETLDPIGGHIPGAINHVFRLNLDEKGLFKSPEELRKAFESLIANRSGADLIMQCGSGVSACHNLLAFELAGISGALLYPGSWSEWCAQEGAEIATGPE